jgi:hypothetical protein
MSETQNEERTARDSSLRIADQLLRARDELDQGFGIGVSNSYDVHGDPEGYCISILTAMFHWCQREGFSFEEQLRRALDLALEDIAEVRTSGKAREPVLFPLGQVVGTPGALEALERNNVKPADYLNLHAAGDWGSMDEEDKRANTVAVKSGARLMSAYNLADGTRLWIITEATDDAGARAATTLLLPDEY